MGGLPGCLFSLTRRAQLQVTNTQETGLQRFHCCIFGVRLWTPASAGTGGGRTPGLISRPTRSRKLSEFPSKPLVREASISDLRGSCAFEEAPNLLGKSRRTQEGEEGGLGLCPERGQLSLVALIAEACCLGLAGFGCLAMNEKAEFYWSLYSHVEITDGFTRRSGGRGRLLLMAVDRLGEKLSLASAPAKCCSSPSPDVG